MRLGVSPAAAPTPMGAFNQRFEALFPRAGALGYAVCFAPGSSSQFLCARVWGTGSAGGQIVCPFRPTLLQSRSRHGHASPLHPGARLCPSYWSGCMFLFYLLGVGLPSPSDFLSVLVVRGGAVCLPTPPSWFRNSSFLRLVDN